MTRTRIHLLETSRTRPYNARGSRYSDCRPNQPTTGNNYIKWPRNCRSLDNLSYLGRFFFLSRKAKKRKSTVSVRLEEISGTLESEIINDVVKGDKLWHKGARNAEKYFDNRESPFLSGFACMVRQKPDYSARFLCSAVGDIMAQNMSVNWNKRRAVAFNLIWNKCLFKTRIDGIRTFGLQFHEMLISYVI